MPAIVYNTRFDPAYRNAAAVIPDADYDYGIEEEKKTPSSSGMMEKYFFMAVIVIGLGVLIYKYKDK